ncbi:AAA family ATPase, partial [Rubritalea profundi]
RLIYYSSSDQDFPKKIGELKIGAFDFTQGRPPLDTEFESFPDHYFSLGQEDTYYENLNEIGDTYRAEALIALRDIAANDSIYQEVKELEITKISVTRGVKESWILNQFRRMTKGAARLTEYDFLYNLPRARGDQSSGRTLSFVVKPESLPPSNIHVLIGRNGVGKSRTLNKMAKSLIYPSRSAAQHGNFVTRTGSRMQAGNYLFSNLVSVSFSAFDDFDLSAEDSELTYKYIGLRRTSNRGAPVGTPKSPDMLANDFHENFCACSAASAKTRRLKLVIERLSNDTLFAYTNPLCLFEMWESHKPAVDTPEAWSIANEGHRLEVCKWFKKLSSGHQIILLTLTALVEHTEEKTLVLLDEPEGHLHPPLIAAFIRALSDLLTDRNGVAIVATHSPVILQEVPKSCVWRMDRYGADVSLSRPTIETFGENTGILTREIFGIIVDQAGFHSLLEQAVDNFVSFDEAMEDFNGSLGFEAQAILRNLFATKNQ